MSINVSILVECDKCHDTHEPMGDYQSADDLKEDWKAEGWKFNVGCLGIDLCPTCAEGEG